MKGRTSAGIRYYSYYLWIKKIPVLIFPPYSLIFLSLPFPFFQMVITVTSVRGLLNGLCLAVSQAAQFFHCCPLCLLDSNLQRSAGWEVTEGRQSGERCLLYRCPNKKPYEGLNFCMQSSAGRKSTLCWQPSRSREIHRFCIGSCLKTHWKLNRLVTFKRD